MSSSPEDPFEDPTDPFVDPIDPFGDPSDANQSSSSSEELSGRPPPYSPANPFDEGRVLKYGAIQATGALRQQWVSSPSIPCPIAGCTLTLDNLSPAEWYIVHDSDTLPQELLSDAIMSALSIESNEDIENTLYEATVLERFVLDDMDQKKVTCNWIGRTGPGTIFLEDILRASNTDAPHISQLSQAAYEKNYDIESLERVFVVDVLNAQTSDFIKLQLYSEANGLSWPDPVVRTWEYNTPEYQALLGTPLGMTVVALVLGAFPRGTRRIARIASWQVGLNYLPQLRFDIEPVI